jgi:hypothetical protein
MSRALLVASILGASGLAMASEPSTRPPPLGPDEPVAVERDAPALLVARPAVVAVPLPPEGAVLVGELAPRIARTREPSVAQLRGGRSVRGLPGDCAAHLLREWVLVECKSGNLALVGGSGDDVRLTGQPGFAGFVLVFPVRPGDRRTFEVRDVTFAPAGYGGKFAPQAVASRFVLSELWLEGDTAPEIVVSEPL